MDHDQALQRLKLAYDSELLREHGHRTVDLLADYLAETMDGAQVKPFPWQPPEHSGEFWNDPGQFDSPEQLFQNVLEQSIRLHHPQYMGHQINPAVPIAALGGLISDFLNNGMGIYEMGMAGAGMERLIAKLVTRRFGMDEQADGFLTSGGSLANLTALLAARSVKQSSDIWEQGGGTDLAAMVSQQAHYCVDRASRIMGWGSAGLIKVPTNEQFQMRTELLPELFEQAKRAGKKVIAVIGSACSTSTGSFDDLQAIGDFCAQRDLWFHVDGAHGAAVAFSEKYRHLVRGIERADSVTMDFHKLCMAPAITSGLFFRNGSDAYKTFAQQADYLWSGADQDEWFNIAKRSFECTKNLMVLRIYSILAAHGVELFDANVTCLIDLAKQFADLVRGRKDLELAVEPECNIVCFRYRGSLSDNTAINRSIARIRDRLIKLGDYYIVQTTLNGEIWLRCTIANPFTTDREMNGLLDKIAELAAD